MTQEEFFKRYTYSPSRDRIGGGSFGTVYKAYDNVLHREVAIKVSEVKTTADGKKTFSLKDEFEALAHVPKHPNIANYEELYTFEDHRGLCDYAVMQYYPDGNLSNAIKQGLTAEQKEDIALQLLEGIGFLHKHKVVHRDLKPGNILIVKHEGRIIPLITDFGLSKAAGVVDGSVFSNSFGAGTPRYSSPEQLQGNPLRFNTDLWSYGAILYELFTGQQLFTAGSGAANTAQADLEIYNKIVNGDVRSLRGMPETWRKVAERCLVVDPTQRAKDAAELFAIVEDDETEVGDRGGGGVGGDPPPPEPEPKPNPIPKKALWIGLGIAAAAALVALVVVLFKPRLEDSSTISTADLTITVNGVSFVMKRVEGGTFLMGAQDDVPYEPNYDTEAGGDESPVHSVTVSSFYMGETEVTQALWKAVMGSNPSYFKGDNLPVESVSWNDCQEFIRTLNQLTGRSFRLPTEAEWEFAARGGNQSHGYKYAGSNKIGRVAWYNRRRSHSVKGKSSNELGLYDMSGNVREWCSDWYRCYENGSQTNPKGPLSGSSRVLRGGGWGSYARRCRVSFRNYRAPHFGGHVIGFRLCLPVFESDTWFDSEMESVQEDLNQGSLEGVFSVGDNKKVVFSKGNLQYRPSTNTWRFAENQLDYIGVNNADISPTYDGWIDGFGWGTSGYDHGAVCYMPYSVDEDNKKYCAYGSKDYNLYDQSGKADWGYNRISNGGNTENLWRCLSEDEWKYLLEKRNTKSNIRFARAVVNGVKGLLLLPDDWDSAIYKLNKANVNHSISFKSNVISLSDWDTLLQTNGVVFLPEATSCYWTSTSYYKVQYARCVDVSEYLVGMVLTDRFKGNSVRLVRTIQ